MDGKYAHEAARLGAARLVIFCVGLVRVLISAGAGASCVIFCANSDRNVTKKTQNHTKSDREKLKQNFYSIILALLLHNEEWYFCRYYCYKCT